MVFVDVESLTKSVTRRRPSPCLCKVANVVVYPNVCDTQVPYQILDTFAKVPIKVNTTTSLVTTVLSANVRGNSFIAVLEKIFFTLFL